MNVTIDIMPMLKLDSEIDAYHTCLLTTDPDFYERERDQFKRDYWKFTDTSQSTHKIEIV